MRNLNEFLNESKLNNSNIKIYGQKNEDLKKIYSAVTTYIINDIIGDSVDLKVYFKKLNKRTNGSIELYDTIKNISTKKFKLVLDKTNGTRYHFTMLAHEITHIKQVLKGELAISDDNKHLLWKGKPYLTVTDYLKVVSDYDFETYKNLPWEKEAYYNGSIYVDKILNSDTLTNLKGESDQMDFIISMLY